MKYLPIYQQFFTVDSSPNESGFIKVNCCFGSNHGNEDKNKSASFNVDSGVYHCAVCGSMSVYNFLKRHKGFTYSQSEEYIKALFNKGDHEFEYAKHSPRDFSELSSKILYQLERLPIAKAYAARTNTSIELLEQLGIGYLSAKHTNWNQDSLVFPYTVNGKVVGVRYRNIYGAKGGEDKSLLVPWGLDDFDPSKPTIIVEGDTDRVTATNIFKDLINVNVLSTPNSHFQESWARFFDNYNMPIIVIPQDDVPGKKLISSTKEALGPDRVFICRLPFGRKSLGKDLTDWAEDNDARILIKKFKHKLEAKVSNTVVTARDFADQVSSMPEDEFFIDNLLYPGSVAIIAGKQKAFKTYFTLALIRSILDSAKLCGIPLFPGVRPNTRILFLEGEGSERKFNNRVMKSLHSTPYRDNLYIGFKTGHRLDDYESVEKLLEVVIANDINLLIVDPLQRFSRITEDSATENADLWDNINYLLNGKPGLSIIILMHFHKNGKASDKWDAIRGTSRHGGEADLGFFLERLSIDTVKLVIDGREYSQEEDTFTLKFLDDLLHFVGNADSLSEEDNKVYENVIKHVKEALKAGAKSITLSDLCKSFEVKDKFLKTFIAKEPELVIVEGGGRGKKATIELKPSE